MKIIKKIISQIIYWLNKIFISENRHDNRKKIVLSSETAGNTDFYAGKSSINGKGNYLSEDIEIKNSKYLLEKDDMNNFINIYNKNINNNEKKEKQKIKNINTDSDVNNDNFFSHKKNNLNKKKSDKKEESQKKYFDKDPLPHLYFVDEIILMPKNTNTLFTYWEIKEDTFEKLSKEYSVSDNPIIKIYNEYGDEIQKIQEWTRIGQRYILNLKENSTYYAVIGYEDKYSNFYTVSQSKGCITPRSQISENNELTWGTMNFHKVEGENLFKKQDQYKLISGNIEFLDLIVKTNRLHEMYSEELSNALKQMIGYNYVDDKFLNNSVVQSKILGNINEMSNSEDESTGEKKVISIFSNEEHNNDNNYLLNNFLGSSGILGSSNTFYEQNNDK